MEPLKWHFHSTVETRYTALRYNRGFDIPRVRVWIPKNLPRWGSSFNELIIVSYATCHASPLLRASLARSSISQLSHSIDSFSIAMKAWFPILLLNNPFTQGLLTLIDRKWILFLLPRGHCEGFPSFSGFPSCDTCALSTLESEAAPFFNKNGQKKYWIMPCVG